MKSARKKLEKMGIAMRVMDNPHPDDDDGSSTDTASITSVESYPEVMDQDQDSAHSSRQVYKESSKNMEQQFGTTKDMLDEEKEASQVATKLKKVRDRTHEELMAKLAELASTKEIETKALQAKQKFRVKCVQAAYEVKVKALEEKCEAAKKKAYDTTKAKLQEELRSLMLQKKLDDGRKMKGKVPHLLLQNRDAKHSLEASQEEGVTPLNIVTRLKDSEIYEDYLAIQRAERNRGGVKQIYNSGSD